MLLKSIVVVLLVLFTGSVFWAAQQDSLFLALERMLQEPWGAVTLFDLYIGFFLFSIFIYRQEGSWKRTLPWSLAIMGLGNLVALVYVLKLLFKDELRAR